jgi:hypothetical protein
MGGIIPPALLHGEIIGLDNDYWTLKEKNIDGFQHHIITLIATEFRNNITFYRNYVTPDIQ